MELPKEAHIDILENVIKEELKRITEDDGKFSSPYIIGFDNGKKMICEYVLQKIADYRNCEK